MLLLVIILIIRYTLSSDIGYMMHISDIHYDQYYHKDTPISCVFGDYFGLKCCHKNSIPIKNSNLAGKWGDYNCDTPYDLIDYTFNWVSTNILELDYIIWSGDSASHNDLIQSFKMNMGAVNTTTSLLNKYFKNVKIFPVIGNHDTYPVDQLTIPNPDTFVTRTIGKIWEKWLNIEKGGYYTLLVKKGFRIVGLNCLYHDKNNIFIRNKKDPANQNSWLENVLQNATNNNEKVWLISHIPPTSSSNNFTRFMVNLVKK